MKKLKQIVTNGWSVGNKTRCLLRGKIKDDGHPNQGWNKTFDHLPSLATKSGTSKNKLPTPTNI